MVLYPFLAQMTGLGAAASGIFLGGSIHEVAHAVAAGYSVNSETGDMATVAKLLRVALLAPACIAVSFASAGRGTSPKTVLAVAAVLFGRLCRCGIPERFRRGPAAAIWR